MRGDFRLTLAAVVGFLWLATIALAPAQAASEVPDRPTTLSPVRAVNGMVASQEAVATRIGVDILKRGGNAVDAAVAVGFALAVTLPRAGNLGGGGFMMVHLAKTGETHAVDFREMAPAAATRDMFLDVTGDYDRELATRSYRAVGVPGTVAGLTLALRRFGTKSLAEVLAPVIALARDGIEVTRSFRNSLTDRRQAVLKRWPESRRVFFRPDGSPYPVGAIFRQPDLAASLSLIATEGPAAFYEGEIAGRIADDMAANGGLITRDDLARYRPVLREPVQGTYRGYEIRSMPPPSSGGIHLIQMLNVLEGFDIAAMGHNSANAIHTMVEAMKFAYADRSRHLGDPAFWKVPVGWLTSKGYARTIRERIVPDRARPAAEIAPAVPTGREGTNTTHFSVMDSAGNVVSNTYTINLAYGSGIVARGTGILLNNEMDDFSAKPGTPNSFGLVGGDANAVAPGKRPLSSMTPTIVLRDGRPVLATGSPGGSRIITTVLQVVLNVIDHRMNVAAATAVPRVHHQWLPDRLRVEQGISADALANLAARGHDVRASSPMGSVQSVMAVPGGFTGYSDLRRSGALTLGH